MLGWIGFASYAMVVSIAFLGFWVSRGGNLSEIMPLLAAPSVTAGAAILAAGIFVARRANRASDTTSTTRASH